MSSLTRKLISITFMIASCTLYAEQTIYQWQSKSGEIHFSDRPHEGAKKLIINDINTYKEPIEKSTSLLPLPPLKNIYTQCEIISPINNSTIRNSTGTLQALLEITPELRNKHLIQYLLDGIKLQSPTIKKSLELFNVNRGEHTLSAQIVDEFNRLIMSTPSITFFMHRPFTKVTNNKS